MFVKPAVDRARFRENLAEAMAAKGHDTAAMASASGLEEAVIRDAIVSGALDDQSVSAIASAVEIDREKLAPLINLRDPDRRDRLPPAGRNVPDSVFWRRRLADGSVVAAEAPAEPAGEPKTEPAANPQAGQNPAPAAPAVAHEEEAP